MPTEGLLHGPGFSSGTNNDMRINREEMFAPCLLSSRSLSYDEALQTGERHQFGLDRWHRDPDLARATHFRRNAEIGCVMVNLANGGHGLSRPIRGPGRQLLRAARAGQLRG